MPARAVHYTSAVISACPPAFRLFVLVVQAAAASGMRSALPFPFCPPSQLVWPAPYREACPTNGSAPAGPCNVTFAGRSCLLNAT
jgi:hypothetical protein